MKPSVGICEVLQKVRASCGGFLWSSNFQIVAIAPTS